MEYWRCWERALGLGLSLGSWRQPCKPPVLPRWLGGWKGHVWFRTKCPQSLMCSEDECRAVTSEKTADGSVGRCGPVRGGAPWVRPGSAAPTPLASHSVSASWLLWDGQFPCTMPFLPRSLMTVDWPLKLWAQINAPFGCGCRPFCLSMGKWLRQEASHRRADAANPSAKLVLPLFKALPLLRWAGLKSIAYLLGYCMSLTNLSLGFRSGQPLFQHAWACQRHSVWCLQSFSEIALHHCLKLRRRGVCLTCPVSPTLKGSMI